MTKAISIVLYVLAVVFGVLAAFNTIDLVMNVVPWIAGGELGSLLIRSLATLITIFVALKCWFLARGKWGPTSI